MTRENVSLAWADLRQSIDRLPLAIWLGWRDALLPYRAAVVGPFWITLYVAIWSFGIGYVLKPHLGAAHPHYLVYVTVGISVFTVLTTFFSDWSNAFVREANLILNVPNPILIYILKLAAKASIELILSLPVIMVAMTLTELMLPSTSLLALPGFAILLTFG